MSRLLIANGRIICAATGRDEIANLWIEGDVIARISPVEGHPSAVENSASGYEVFDARGLLVAPGFIDLHTHLREPGREDCETIESGTEAAAAGGFTSVCAMPNTQPVNDAVSTTEDVVRRAQLKSKIRVFPIAAVSKNSAGGVLTDFEALMRAGAVGFSDDGKPVKTGALMRQALESAKRLTTFVSDHCEDLALTQAGVIHQGAVSKSLQLAGLPREAEDSIVKRDIECAEKTGGHVHIAHLSTAGALDLVRDAKQRGVNVTCEVTPHHFSLTEEAVRQYGSNAKMKPPLRTAKDVEALKEGLADGTVDAIATDHAPHSAAEKGRGLEAAPFGVIGLETALPLAIKNLVMTSAIGWSRLVEVLSANPARMLRRTDLGRIEVGAKADLTIIDPKLKWVYRTSESRSRSRNSPFDGWPFVGRAVGTMVGGKWVFRAAPARAGKAVRSAP